MDEKLSAQSLFKIRPLAIETKNHAKMDIRVCFLFNVTGFLYFVSNILPGIVATFMQVLLYDNTDKDVIYQYIVYMQYIYTYNIYFYNLYMYIIYTYIGS